MKLDLRYPALVFLGAWNPAIFQPPWIARYLYKLPEGERVLGSQVTVMAPTDQKHIIFISDVGLAASTNSVEIFLNADNDATRKLAEKVAIRLLSTLLHTPLGGFGVNCHYIETDPEVELLDKFNTSEKINEHYKILGSQFSSAIKVSDGVTLNFSRRFSESEVLLDFNYHYERINKTAIKDTITSVLKKHLDSSLQSLNQLYDLNEYEVLAHEFHIPAEAAN